MYSSTSLEIYYHHGELILSIVTKHKFLGIYIEFLENRKVLFLVKYNFKEPIALFNENLDTTVSSPEKTFYIM